MTYFVCPTPRRGGLRSVTAKYLGPPSRQFREDGREDSKLAPGGGSRVRAGGWGENERKREQSERERERRGKRGRKRAKEISL